MSEDLGGFSMIELFRLEAEGQLATLTRKLLAIENAPADAGALEEMMRAAHSLKGAARIVGLDAAVNVAHAMEDCFVAAQHGRLALGPARIDALLRGVDWLGRISKLAEAEVEAWTATHAGEIEAYVTGLGRLGKEGANSTVMAPAPAPVAVKPASSPTTPAAPSEEEADRVLRVTAENLNRLLGLAGESLVESRRLEPFNRDLLRLKRGQLELARGLERLQGKLSGRADEAALAALREVRAKSVELLGLTQARIEDMERFDRAATRLATRLYREARAVRMRPFADGIQPFEIGRAHV